MREHGPPVSLAVCQACRCAHYCSPVCQAVHWAGRAATGGKAFPQMVFSHWQVLAGDPTDPETKPGKVITDVRARKGLAPEIPPLDRFLDRL